MEHPLASTTTAWQRVSPVGLLARGYDWLAAPQRRHAIEQLIVQLAAWGLIAHLVLIGLASLIGGRLTTLVGSNWLAAIYTPFVAILLYEVLLLVLAIPASTTRALALQFQIVSLIVIRNTFKDLAALDQLGALLDDTNAQVQLALDMIGGVVLFGLVAVFYRVAGWPSAHQQAMRAPSAALSRYIERKKAIAASISVIFVVMVVVTSLQWGQDSWSVLAGTRTTAAAPVSPTTPLFQTLFAVMILADILLLVLSLQLSDAYQHVFRGASFVIATIMLRVALSADRPLQVVIAVAALLFSTVVLAIYKTWARDPWEASPQAEPTETRRPAEQATAGPAHDTAWPHER